MQNNSASVVKKILSRTKRFLPAMILSLILAVIHVAAALMLPIFVGQGIDCILSVGQVDFSGIRRALICVLGCACAGAAAQWVMSQINNYVTYHVAKDIRNEAFSHIQRLPLSYLDTHSQGDIISRVISDVDTFADGLLMGFTQLFTGVLTIVGTLVIMLRLHWGIALVVIFITPISLLVANFIAKKTYTMFRDQAVVRGDQTGLIDETVSNLRVVQTFGHQRESLEAFDSINDQLHSCSLKAIFFSSLTNPCTRFVNSLVYAGVGLSGALLAIQGAVSVGNLTSFLSYANQYTKPFNEISGVITELQNAIACVGRVFDLLETESYADDTEGPEQKQDFRGNIEIRDLYFSYIPEKPLLEDIDLTVAPGQRVAIVGPTGCGKTTFINLLMRFYDPNSGEIILDGINTRHMGRQRLRRNIGMVLQDTWLKAGTIWENIAMGRPDATAEEILEAAKQAHAHSFIRKLPKGYDTVIGEDGGNLSQGQKQLLCIARVMLCLPPILILDEATSSIDTRTELKIQQAFRTMMEGRTSFIVAHRLSTVREADIILVMKDGHIIEQGNHDTLLKKGGFYSQLYNSQFAH